MTPTSFIHPDPERIIVPRRHAAVLVEPGYAALTPALTASSAPASIMGIDRAAARAELLAAAHEWARRTASDAPPANALARPWVLTGHQMEFYHAGVWAKVIATDELARRTNAVGFDILVDHDVVDQMGFDVPVQSGTDAWKRQAVDWVAASNFAADGLSAPSLAQFEEWDAELARHPIAQSDALAFVLADSRAAIASAPQPPAYTAWLSRARRHLEQAFDLNVYHIPTSLLCQTNAWYAFVAQWAANAESWTAAYNRHLAAYRVRAGIKNPQHPMPDLQRTPDTFELPFWIYRLGQPRERLFVRKPATGAPAFLHGQAVLPLNSEFRILNSEFQIRPRALTLTMFVRLHLADLFIHGIGGALYDQITDALMQELFSAAPPYACVSAAWLLPLGQAFVSEDIPALKSRLHHTRHNPQRAIDPFTALKTDVAELIMQRRALLQQIDDSMQADRRGGKVERREWFRELHAVNESLHAKAPRILANLDKQLADASTHLEQNRTLLWREWFFALHSMESLQQLIMAVRGLRA